MTIILLSGMWNVHNDSILLGKTCKVCAYSNSMQNTSKLIFIARYTNCYYFRIAGIMEKRICIVYSSVYCV